MITIPTTTGYFIFRGDRHIRNGTYERLHVPVEVIEVNGGNGKTTLGVRMIGRQQAWLLRMFVGEWQRICLEESEL